MKISRCRSCRKPITWALTRHGNLLPFDYPAVADGGYSLFELGEDVHCMYVKPAERQPDELLFKSHYATCVDAEKWRKT